MRPLGNGAVTAPASQCQCEDAVSWPDITGSVKKQQLSPRASQKKPGHEKDSVLERPL